MINSNELRIGNTIYDRHGNITHIHSGWFYITQDPKRLKDYSPIPLTPEVLLAAGFQNFDNTWIVGRISEWEVHLMKYGFVITHETCDPRIWNIPINTLHGVQNAIFALTGTELEIDITKI